MNNNEMAASEQTDRQTLASVYVLFTRQDRHRRRRLVSVGIKCSAEAPCCSQTLLHLARSEQLIRTTYGHAFHSRAITSKQVREGVFRIGLYFILLISRDQMFI
jgi:hypothetical protein